LEEIIKPAEKIAVGSEGEAERQFRSKKFRTKFRICYFLLKGVERRWINIKNLKRR